MLLMRYQIESEELLIFRDGRPFGEFGTFGGNSIPWPNPQTLAGMMRTAVGMGKSEDYFSMNNPKREQNLNDILNIGLHQILPMQRSLTNGENWQALFPLPGDIILTQNESSSSLIVNQMSFTCLDARQGTDISNPDWLYAQLDIKDKPAREQPFFCHWFFYQKYLQAGFETPKSYKFDQIGISVPVKDTRVHNALSKETLTTEEGRLFCNNGFYLKTKTKNGSSNIDSLSDLSIHFTMTGFEELTTNKAYLGGERKQVAINNSSVNFPEFPNCFNNKSWLKIILTTQGDFANWCPDWLMPDLTANEITWVNIPETDFTVRLRSACIKGWDSVSGWNAATHQPKAYKKLVKTGSVYLLEIQNPQQSADIAQYFWGNVLDSKNQQAVKNGYGQCIVANALVNN